MRVLTVFGTRPEMIKMWGVLRKLDDLNFDHIMVHTGQNFTPELKDFFFRDLQLRRPDYELGIDTSSYACEVADIVRRTDDIMAKTKPDALIVLGDTYSGLCVLPASNRGIKIFHMEAGLRAWDRRMPEQRNRILIDHISNVLLPFNGYHRENLIRENIHPSKIFVTGNTVFEVMRVYASCIDASNILSDLSLGKKGYILVTAHRSENVDGGSGLRLIFEALGRLREELQLEVIYPMHPRTRSKMNGLKIPNGIRVIDPLGFFDFNKLLKESRCILSDSGTAAEEGLFYGVPCVNLRMATERPETIESGGVIVSGLDPNNIVESVATSLGNTWAIKYEFENEFSPSTVVINAIRSQITNFF